MGASCEPQHGESYAKFCGRTNWHNNNLEKHKKITDKFKHLESGSIYCYKLDKLNVKQRNLCDDYDNQDFYIEVVFVWFGKKWLLCYMSNILKQEFESININERDKMFNELKFQNGISKRTFIKYTDNWYPELLQVKEPNSEWYLTMDYQLTDDRKQFLKQLCKIGFARYISSQQVVMYCTEEQYDTFIIGHNSRPYEQLEKNLLQQLK